MKATIRLLIARVILSAIAVMTIVSPFLADWNATHIYNPLWLPHAKFHNADDGHGGAARAVGPRICLATRRCERFVDGRLDLRRALLVSQAIAFLFPGVAWTDPNLMEAGHLLDEFPLQLPGDLVLLALLAVAAWLIVSAARAGRSSRA